MNQHSAHDADLVAAAVLAAICEGARRRTVAVVASAAVGALAFRAYRPSQLPKVSVAHARDEQSEAEAASDPAHLLASLRVARRG